MADRRGILVMAYGTPGDLDAVEEYYTDIRRGRPPPADLLEELVGRYRAIGGTSPLLDITSAQARGIEERLGISTYLGMKHAPPFVRDGVAAMAKDGVERAVGLVLAPHFSKMSIGDYATRAAAAAEETGWKGDLEVVRSWHLEPGYIEFLARAVSNALHSLAETERSDTTVVFTAHSLPARIVQAGDPYPEQLQETAQAVADLCGLRRWRIGWQSAGHTDDPWLGPDVLEIVTDLAAHGARGVVVCPCGFVSDHLEVLYDLDIECRDLADDLGIAFARTPSPNVDPSFLDTLADVVRRAFGD
ncbi:MAG: ferrochelatase [Actinomycetota bacterium]